jgi:predicted enzyme related to lactoylglutathione lyase
MTSSSFGGGAVVYAKDLQRVRTFYEGVVGFAAAYVASDHVVLRLPAFELVIVTIPRAIADSLEIAQPPRRRTDTAIKLVFPIHDIAAARTVAPRYGGEIDPPEKEWAFQGLRVCDGHDPEGNVIQLRQSNGA